MSYAPDLGELAQRLAVDVHQILNGAKPGDIPIYRPNKFQLLVNLKAAKALSLEMPPTLLVQCEAAGHRGLKLAVRINAMAVFLAVASI